MKFFKHCLLATSMLTATQGFASDHIDGPVTTGHGVADLADLFSYPTPHKPGFLTVILDTYPMVLPSGHFTDKVTYNVHIRRAHVSGAKVGFETSDEVTIKCTSTTPDDHTKHSVTCATSNGLVASSLFNSREPNVGDDFRLFVGLRSDPFFFNATFAETAATKGKILPPEDKNIMDKINVLSIVMELDLAKVFGSNPPAMIAIAAESITQDAPNAPVRRLDRVGRPEITNVSLVARTESELRDIYNLDRPFQVAPANQKTYQDRLASNIKYYDSLDSQKDWVDGESEKLAALLADDFLVVDITKPCQGDDFMEIEKSLLLKKEHQTCGGRKPTDDIMDTLFSLYISGIDGKPVRDGVDRPSLEVSEEFPYLAEPDLSWAAWAKVKAVKVIFGIQDLIGKFK